MARERRRLAAIVAADVVGYSRLMGRDEAREAVRKYRAAYPDVTVAAVLEAVPTTSAAYSRRVGEGLRLAGLPE